MQHLMRIIGLLLAISCQQVQPLQTDGYPYVSKHNENLQISRRRLAQHDYDGPAYSHYSQQPTAPYEQPQLVQMSAFHNPALYGYGTASGAPSNTQPLPTHPSQRWSGAPIIVDYGGDYLEQEQRTLPQSNYALPPATLQPTSAAAHTPFLSTSTATAADLQSQTPQRFSFDLNNGNNYNSRGHAGHFNRQSGQQQYLQQQLPANYQQQPPPLSLPARYQLQQLPPHYQQPQWSSPSPPNAIPRTRDNAAKYAAHFASYVRKHPYRLQPIFQPNDYKKR